LYDFGVQLPERLLKSIRKQAFIKPGDRVAAAVSGGSDSISLLLLLLELRSELGIVLSVAHVNHQLRGHESDADQHFIEELCALCSLELHSCNAAVESTQSGIEAAARELRYQFFRQLAHSNPGLKIATGHTLDDQAETVLLRILRGTGIRGLAGIHPRVVLEEQGRPEGEVVRPLLAFRRSELQDFLRDRGQRWREDSTNQDPRFLRNRIRHTVLPLLGDSTVENLADLAEIARAEDEHWKLNHPELRADVGDLPLASLRSMPLATQRRLIRAWIEVHQPRPTIFFRMIEDILELARSEQGGAVELASGWRIRHVHDALRFEQREAQILNHDYEYLLPIPGEIVIPELDIRLQVEIVDQANIAASDQANLLEADRLPRTLIVRNWHPGDRFWPAHTKQPRKVKELLSNRHVTGIEKKLWPVIVADDQLVWVRGFPTASDFRPQSGASRAVWIREHRCG
jgi:tRNA(Ile)-lysidine synthase